MEPKGVVAASQPRWIPVAERLPDVGVWVLVWHHKDCCLFDKLEDNKKWWFNEEEEITHWMPLPEKPKEVANAGTP